VAVQYCWITLPSDILLHNLTILVTSSAKVIYTGLFVDILASYSLHLHLLYLFCNTLHWYMLCFACSSHKILLIGHYNKIFEDFKHKLVYVHWYTTISSAESIVISLSMFFKLDDHEKEVRRLFRILPTV